MSSNPVHHKRTKHIELDIHFVWERVQLGDLRVLHADIMTKGLPTPTFEAFRSSLCVVKIKRQTAGGDVSNLHVKIKRQTAEGDVSNLHVHE